MTPDEGGPVLDALAGLVLRHEAPRRRRLSVFVDISNVRTAIRRLSERFGPVHLSTVTAVNARPDALDAAGMSGGVVELIYHLWLRPVSTEVSLHAFVPGGRAVESIAADFPAARLYEGEIADLFGVGFTGETRAERLILPDEWPAGSHPMGRAARQPQQPGSGGGKDA